MWSRLHTFILAAGMATTLGVARAEQPPEALVAPMPGHRDLAAEHARLAAERPPVVAPWRPILKADTPTGPRLTREVMGYLPYWSYTASSPYIPLRWDLMSILAWFSVEMDATGRATNLRGWGGTTTARIVEEAHRHGVKVIVTITNFDDDAIADIVGSETNRQHAIETCLSLIETHGADGINIDFEFVPRVARDGFVTFMADLKQAVAARRPNGHEGHVSLAGPAVDWNGAYDYRALLEQTDGIMVMAYGYHWSGGQPGPTAPLEVGDLWNSRSIAWTANDYERYGGAENLNKVLIGLPWYGRSWQVADESVPGTRTGAGGARFYRIAEPEAQRHGKRFEPISQTAYYHMRTDGNLYQVWYDDETSLTAKIAWVDDRGLGGIGIWALGYEGDGPDLWNSIDVTIGPAGPDWVEPSPEPVVEEGAETPVETGPEPMPEAAAEPVPTDVGAADTDTEPEVDATSGDTSGVIAGRPGRRVELRGVPAEDDGCGGGAGGSGMWLFLVWLLGRRRWC